MSLRQIAALLAAGALAWSGCTPEQLAEADPTLGEAELEIINGNAVARGSLAWRGIVRVNSSIGLCTGTLLSNRIVLTARHCVRTWTGNGFGAAGTNIRVTLEGPTAADDQTITATRTREPNTNTLNAGDYALIELSAPMEVGGSTDGFVNPIYDDTDASLVGQSVFCAGYGNNTEAVVRRGIGVGGGGAGTLRSATLTVGASGGNTITLNRNRGNQIGAPGDSGSTCFVNGQVVGVQSTCAGPWTDLNGDNTLQGNEWTRINTCTAASPGAYRLWANPRIFADVNISMPTVPALGHSVPVLLRAVNDTDVYNIWTAASVGMFALRGGWLIGEASAPPGYVCTRPETTTPVRGDATLDGACLSAALAASVSM